MCMLFFSPNNHYLPALYVSSLSMPVQSILILLLFFFSRYSEYVALRYFLFVHPPYFSRMVVGTRVPAKAQYAARGGAATARSLSSSSSDNVALPTRVVSERGPRCVGRVSDDDFETSSYEETSKSSFSDDNSEEFVPLVFGYINDNPRRRAGAPARTQAPTGVSEEVGSQSSLSDASPLEIFFERANAKRNCGRGSRHVEQNEVNTSLSSYDDDEASAVSDALPVEFERKKRTRSVGKVHNPTYEMSDSESTLSLSNEDEEPLNAQLIYTLVKRLRNPLDNVTPEAFDYVDFNDANFREVLEPLKQIKACLERRASYPLKQNGEIDREIKAAVQSLPSQKAIAAKVQMVKSRQLRPAQPTNRIQRGGEAGPQNAEVLEVLVAKLRNPKEEVALREFEKVDWADRNFEPVLLPLRQVRAYMEAKEIVTRKPADGAMDGVTALDEKIKVAIMSLPAEKEMAAKVAAVSSRPMSRDAANGEAIRELIARLKDPGQEVQASAFEKLDWNDEQFSRELQPLMQIRAFLEARECSQRKAGEATMGGMRALDDRIYTATMSLPAEKEMAAKVRAVKSRQLRATGGQGSAHYGSESSPEQVAKARTATASAPAEVAKGAAVQAVRSRPMSRCQTNGEGILHLIKRLKDPEQLVPLRAFDQLDWNDRNFARELEPLQQIRMYMEARETLKRAPGEKTMSGVPDLDEKIKVAVLALPAEKAVAVKIQMLKERDMVAGADEAKPQTAKVGKISAPAGTVKKVRDGILVSGNGRKSKSKDGKLSASTSQVMQVGAKVMAAHQRKCKPRESTALSEPTKTMRRTRHAANRSVSFLKVEETAAGEIVDKDQLLAEASGPQRLQDEAHSSPTAATPRNISRVPSRPSKAAERRPRHHRPGNSAVSFSDLPKEEAGTIKEEDERLATTKRKPQRRRAAHKPGRSLSISSLPDLEAGEVVEEAVLPGKPAATEGPKSAARSTAPDGAPKKKRRPRASHKNNRSCSFSEIAVDEASEVADVNAGTLKGSSAEPEAARGAGGAGTPRVTRKLVRRRRPGEQGGTPALESGGPTPEKVGVAGVPAPAPPKPPSRAKGRRTNVPRSRSAETSMVEVEANGEIVELQDEAHALYTPSGKSTPGPQTPHSTRAKDRDLPAAARSVKSGPKSSDIAAAPRKRRQRLHASKELSISAIPEDVAGEIVEDERDIFAETAPTGSLASTLRRSLQSPGGGKVFPAVGNSSRRGSMRYADRPNSSVRSSMEGNRVGLSPAAEPSVLPDAADTTRLLPSQALRRSADPASRIVKPAVKNTNGGTLVPPLRASR